MAKLVVETELDTKNFTRQIEKLEKETKEAYNYLNELNRLKFEGKGFKGIDRAINSASIKAEKLNNQLVSLKDRQSALEVEDEKPMGKGFEKGLNSLKKFALGLFGIRTAFSALRRATNAYLSENEVTANKMNAIWVALGNALGPIIELIANGVLKLIGYLNVFLNALGWKVDLTKNIGKNTKAIKDQTKAQKELNRQTAQFDEMSIVSSNKSASGGGSGATSDAFEMPELNKDIVEFLENLAKTLKDNWDWIWKVGVALGAVFAISKLGGILTGIGALIGTATTGLLGVFTILAAIIGLEIKDFLDNMEKLTEIEKDQTKQTKALVKEDKQIIENKEKEAKVYKKGSKEAGVYFNYLKDSAQYYAGSIKSTAEYVDGLSGLAYWAEEGSGKVDEYNHQLAANNDGLRQNIEAMAKMYTEGQLTTEQEEKFFEILGAVNGRLVNGKVIYDDIDGRILAASKHTEKYSYLVDVLASSTVTDATKMRNSFLEFKKTTDNVFTSLNKTTAKPKIEVQVDTKKLSSVFDTLSKVDGLNSSFASNMSWASSRLKSIGLARGGIVNLPGRGVTLSNVRIGEATGGAEGIVPLNNEESMSLIGQAVAKYVNINLTNNTLLDGKVIAREQRIVSNNIDFATNGRGV